MNDASGVTSRPATAPAPWYQFSSDEVAERLQVDPARGLTADEVQQRLQKYGPNALAAAKAEPAFIRFFKHYADYMQIVLVVAAVVSLLIGEYSTAILLALLTLFNAWLGYHQEGKAEAAAAQLSTMMKSVAKVRRDGVIVEIPADQIVPGDIVVVDAGDRVPADGRIILSATLQVEEGALTGESVAVEKDTGSIPEGDVAIGDRLNMAFMNTNVTRGHGEIIVTTTGMGSEVGHIAAHAGRAEGREDPAHQAGRPAHDLHHHRGAVRVRGHRRDGPRAGRVVRGAVRHRRGAGGRLHPRCSAGGRHHDPVGRLDQHGQEERHHEVPAGRGDARLHLGDQHRQDRHADAQPDDRP